MYATCDASPAEGAIASGDRLVITTTQTYQPIVPLVPIPPLPMTFVSARTIVKQIAGPPECNDGVDNDGDGRIDYPADNGCSSLNDNTEGTTPACYTLDTAVTPTDPFPGGAITVSPDRTCVYGYADAMFVTLTGTIYAPNAPVEITGDSGSFALNSQIIADTVNVGGNGTVTIAYDPSANFQNRVPPQLKLSE